MGKVNYISLEEALEIHKSTIENSGGGSDGELDKIYETIYLVFPNGRALRDELSWIHKLLTVLIKLYCIKEFTYYG